MPSGEKLSEFVAWTQKHITRDKKGLAQLFLDCFLQPLRDLRATWIAAELLFRSAVPTAVKTTMVEAASPETAPESN